MSDRLGRTIQRFQAKIDAGSFYEAHQTLRTIANRYIKANQYEEASNLLYQGSVILSKNKEYTSASDLIIYLLEVYKESKTIDDKEAKDRLLEVIGYIPSADPSLADLSKAAVEWSKTPTNKFGDADLHSLFGAKFLSAVKEVSEEEKKAKLFSVGEFHSILGNSSSLSAYTDFLYEWSRNSDQDPGIFIARAVINYAYLKNIHFVKDSLARFLTKLSAHVEPELVVVDGHRVQFFSKYKIINFVQALAITLEKQDAGQKFLKLYQTYKVELDKVQLTGAVEYLGRFYYGLNLGQPNNQNMLANLMGGLFK